MHQFNFSPFPELETARLCLRRLAATDAERMLIMRSSPEVMKYIDKARAETLADALRVINSSNDLIDKNEGIAWGMALRENPDELIGAIGYWRAKPEHFRAEVGYLLMPDYWKMGYTSEALQTVMDYGFEKMQLHSVEAHCNTDNTASRKLLEKMGFIQEALFRENYFYAGKFLDTVVYGILKNEWK